MNLKKPNKLLKLSSLLLIYQKSTQTSALQTNLNPRLLYINECDSNPCGAKGYCEDHANRAYTCHCDPGVQKDALLSCSVDIDECLSNPCTTNQGNCTRSLIPTRTDYYECACLPGFTGAECEVELNECDSNPCGSHGSCADSTNSFTCTCDSGYAGDTCESEINPCLSSPCENFSACVKTSPGVYVCDCPVGADSSDPAISRTLQCDAEIDECLSNPCQNGGTCENTQTQLNLYKCICPIGYTGFSCETNINDCGTNSNDNPCGDYNNNNGQCTDGIAEFTCACTSGVGATCGLALEECTSNPCGPYGSCSEPVANEYQCSCPLGAESGVSGFSNDAYCNKDTDECASNPCSAHGVCSESEAVLGDNECGVGFQQIQCGSTNKCVKLLAANARVTFYRSKQVFLDYTDAKNFCESLALDSKMAQFKSDPELMSVVNEYVAHGAEWKLEPEWIAVDDPGRSEALNRFYGGIGVIQSIRDEHGHADKMVYEDRTEILLYSAVDDLSDDYVRSSTRNVVIWSDGSISGCSTAWYKNAICEVPIGSTFLQKADFHVCKQLNKKLNFYRCICDSGYNGALCTTDIDECASVPCKNEAVCTNNADSELVTCACQPGWTGEFCDVDINECASGPCGLVGVCSQSGVGSFQCSCSSGWTGAVCGENVDECQSEPCGGNGFCESGVDSYICACHPNYSGVNCENHDTCATINCINQGNCTVTETTEKWKCICPGEFTGNYCETKVPSLIEILRKSKNYIIVGLIVAVLLFTMYQNYAVLEEKEVEVVKIKSIIDQAISQSVNPSKITLAQISLENKVDEID